MVWIILAFALIIILVNIYIYFGKQDKEKKAKVFFDSINIIFSVLLGIFLGLAFSNLDTKMELQKSQQKVWRKAAIETNINIQRIENTLLDFNKISRIDTTLKYNEYIKQNFEIDLNYTKSLIQDINWVKDAHDLTFIAAKTSIKNITLLKNTISTTNLTDKKINELIEILKEELHSLNLVLSWETYRLDGRLEDNELMQYHDSLTIKMNSINRNNGS
jgi:hypothetical protein